MAGRLYYGMECETKKLSKDNKELYTFIVSSEHIDRVGDKMNVKGIDLSEYKRNPVVLRNHSGVAIGKADSIYTEDGKLLADAWFDEITKESQETKAQLDAGTLRTASIGFEPIEMNERDIKEDEKIFIKGRPWINKINEIKKSIMLEFSIVDLPANIYAEIQRGKKKNLDISHLELQYKQMTQTKERNEMDEEIIMEFKVKGEKEIDMMNRFNKFLEEQGYAITKAGATLSKSNMKLLDAIIENATKIKASATPSENPDTEDGKSLDETLAKIDKRLTEIDERLDGWELETETEEEENIIEFKDWKKENGNG